MGALPWADLATLAAGLAVAGLAAGFLAGLFGVGGGAVAVPVLYQVFLVQGFDPDIRMHVAIGSSLGVVVPTAIRSFLAHKRRGAVDMQLLKRWAPWIVTGVAGGAAIANLVSGEEMKIIFSVLIAVLGARLIIGTGNMKLSDRMPGPVVAASGLVIGSSSALMGIGGGTLAATAQILFGRPLINAIATSAGVGVLIAVPGVIGFIIAGWGEEGLPPFSLGFVNLPAVALMVPLSIVTAPLGVALAHRLTKRTLELSFGIFLLIVASRFLFG
ncbi:sulfite exporter TauE/SafE family protein [Lutibaculum baratangense]|uniref:Probable membrane transporter protein n=1 Tax=Lutibaculum baratangense AMV1 TaxID=631454 RepID=V4RKY2_9HYPH|nr:sulfite exporter TauE/SafE family protein [Lutibaculum baratangense]ESR26726.1 putative membrane protein [Lutibaculum baratangense AMV1]